MIGNGDNYYYKVGVYVDLGNRDIRQLTMREYDVLKHLPEYQNSSIIFIVYAVFYKEILFNKFNNATFFGNPTSGSMFSAFFDENYEFVRITHVR
jgi:hypothetical protein